jgi:hypothetical protein
MGTWSPGRIRLVFPEGHPQHGLEVVMRRQRIGEVLTDLIAAPPRTEDELAAMTRDERAAYAVALSERNIAEFASLVVGWNFVDDDGEPVLPSAAGVMLLDQQAFESIQTAYTEATRRVSPPLPPPSDDGEPSEAALTLPMEPL